MPERIYLTGFMGCGKSTIGAILSNVLGYQYLDLDAEIESEITMAIPSFFFTVWGGRFSGGRN